MKTPFVLLAPTEKASQPLRRGRGTVSTPAQERKRQTNKVDRSESVERSVEEKEGVFSSGRALKGVMKRFDNRFCALLRRVSPWSH